MKRLFLSSVLALLLGATLQTLVACSEQTEKSVAVVSPDSVGTSPFIQSTFSLAPGENNWIFDSKSPVVIPFTATNFSDQSAKQKYTLSLTTDKHEPLKDFNKTVSLGAGKSKAAKFDIGKLSAGFYTLTLAEESGDSLTFNIGVEPDNVVSAPDRQPDFQEFWDRARQELAAIAPDYAMELLPEHSNELGQVYKVTMNSMGGHRLQGFLSVPKNPGRYPVVINYNGYSSTCWIPSPTPGMCVMTVSTRGQGDIEENIYGDWIQWNIADPEKYYYRYAFMDCVRAIDFAAQCEWIDPAKMFAQGGSQGGAFTLAAASLDNRLRAIAPDVPFLGDFPDYFQIVNWPAQPVREAQKAAGLSDEQLFRNLSYFDIKNLTPWITCPVLMAFGLQDPTCPPHTNFSAFNNIPHADKSWHVYPLRGHDVWHEASWDSIRIDFFRPFMDE